VVIGFAFETGKIGQITESLFMATAEQSTPPSPKLTFREQMLVAREDAIVSAVNRLLAEKGFDAMTVDEVAAEVGIAKASLYKHFPSKEDLAAAAMVRVMQRSLAFLDSLKADGPPIERLKAVARWTMEVQLAGEMPALPSENSSLRATLTNNKAYVNGLLNVSDRIGGWITEAQADGSINASLPPIAVLYTLYARACDPVLGFLKGSGLYSHEQIIDMVLSTCFDGLKTR
jgi:TetR/AcrR family transcriptional regulator, regulator of autoinduction and epiphytic fitness